MDLGWDRDSRRLRGGDGASVDRGCRHGPRRLARHVTALSMRAPRISIVVCAGILLGAVAACQKSSQVESGAVLLNLTVAPEAPAPDELLVSVYGDGSALWQDARIPDEGALPAPVDGRLGSVLVQPGPSAKWQRPDSARAASIALVQEATLPSGTRRRSAW